MGLVISQIMSLTGMVQHGMKQAADVENQLMSVERVLEYILLPSESNLRGDDILRKKNIKQVLNEEFVNAPSTWPSHGHIEFKNVFMRYSEDTPFVLKELSLVVESGEKVLISLLLFKILNKSVFVQIGIVGRTGAGKSSLISALFRLTKVEGTIAIDNIDCGSIALEDLRKRISIIPQDPVLFSGTLRRNLDPFNEFSDRQLWDVLEEVNIFVIMKKKIALKQYVFFQIG